MGDFLNWVGKVYAELLKLVGNGILVIAGIGACGYAFLQQLGPVHSTPIDTGVLALGIALILFASVRRFVWRDLGFTVPWGLLVIGGSYVLTENRDRFEITPALLVCVFVPPFLVTLILSLLPKPPDVEGKTSVLPPT